MKKTLLISLEYPPQVGGVANFLSGLAEDLPPEDIAVLSSRSPQSYLFDHEKKYAVYRRKLVFKNLIFWPKWFPALLNAIALAKKEKFEHVLVGQVLPLGYIALILKKIFKTPYSVFVYGMDITIPAKNKWKRKMLLFVLNKAEKIICAGSFVRDEVVQLGIALEKTLVVYPCAKEESKLEIGNLKVEMIKKYNLEDKKVLLTVGRLVERKGHDKVIEALPKVLEKMPNIIYLIVGDGPNINNLKSKILNLKLENAVILAGKVSNQDLQDYYALADVFIMPSRDIDGDVEGFGTVFLEAGRFGKAVIGGRSGGVPEAVIDGETGLLVDPVNTDEIAEAIIKLLTNDELRNKLGQQGKERVEKDFVWTKEAGKIEKLLS